MHKEKQQEWTALWSWSALARLLHQDKQYFRPEPDRHPEHDHQDHPGRRHRDQAHLCSISVAGLKERSPTSVTCINSDPDLSHQVSPV
jgi:hypothetical protein